jgi:hypothetical protein
MPYKRLSRLVWTFSITGFVLIFCDVEFFNTLPRLKDSKVMGVADENVPEDPQRQESIVGECAGDSF